MSVNPFMPSTHGHPNFNPSKSVSTKNYSIEMPRATKQPKPPDKPLIPYMRYSKKVWDDVKAQYSDLKVWEISKIVGQMWRDLDENEKQKYIEEFEVEKLEYNELLKQYHSSPAYQSWIASLKTKENEEREGVMMNKKRDKRSHNQMHNSPQRSDGRFSLQPLESSDENDEYFSAKHLAAARYYRNNKLVNDIFTETVVPESRHAFDVKVQVLRRQVDSLTVYQKKMVDELQQIEERFQQKKHSLLESSERFQNEMNKRFAQNDLDTTLKDHYRRTLIKTMEMMKGEQQDNTNVIKPNETQQQNLSSSITTNHESSPNDDKIIINGDEKTNGNSSNHSNDNN
ncbi:SWI/SNF-related matrix-associated actin-dependent regulator of chromatin subfamily E member 1-like [Dermatophagoides pteronyssinus]|uniref:SWI/SNF-related matrix-associated actin-dependent regulator of chromatin subfamily E member 1-like n=1 Tax=Dermatophagoides pteronyssinus TaxID=6956 RepID=UPI003F679948